MRRAVSLSRTEWEQVNISEHKKFFAGDDTLSNYGWLKKKVVKLDYGELDSWASDYKEQLN